MQYCSAYRLHAHSVAGECAQPEAFVEPPNPASALQNKTSVFAPTCALVRREGGTPRHKFNK